MTIDCGNGSTALDTEERRKVETATFLKNFVLLAGLIFQKWIGAKQSQMVLKKDRQELLHTFSSGPTAWPTGY